MIDYSLWEVIENGNAPLITKVVEGVETTIAPTTAEEKAQRRLELKAISNLLIGIPNEHLLKFNSIKDAKSLLQAIEKRLISLIGGKCLQTATKGDTLQGNAGLQGTKKTGIGRTQEGLCQWRQLLLMLWCLVMVLVMIRVIKQKKTVNVEKCKTGLEYNVVPPPYTGNLMPLKPDLSFSGLEEFVNKPIVSEPIIKKPLVETSETKAIEAKPKAVRKNNDSPIIEDWVLDSKEENVSSN
ncbi:hypothetical protein Tco_0294465 [Tanacetum coccineum]